MGLKPELRFLAEVCSDSALAADGSTVDIHGSDKGTCHGDLVCVGVDFAGLCTIGEESTFE